MRTFDVVIVGGGVVGCAVARRLSLTRATVAVVEAATDVGEGASKGNSGIATCGAETTPGTRESELILASADAWEALCASLDTPFERIGTLSLALTPEEEQRLPHLLAEARANGVAAEIVSGAAARRLEPLITPQRARRCTCRATASSTRSGSRSATPSSRRATARPSCARRA